MSDTERKAIDDAVDALAKTAKVMNSMDHTMYPVIDSIAVLTKQFLKDVNKTADGFKLFGRGV